jgi:cytochrome c-type biogenesis protein CcmH/NrfG
VAAPVPSAPAPAPPAEAASRAPDVERLLTQANVSLMVADFAGAVQAYAQVVELEPDVPEHRGKLAVLMTRWPQTLRQAERQFAEALRLDPENAELHYQFGLYYRTMKVPSRAIAEFRTAVRLDPQHKKARAELASVSPDDAVFSRLKKLLR